MVPVATTRRGTKYVQKVGRRKVCTGKQGYRGLGRREKIVDGHMISSSCIRSAVSMIGLVTTHRVLPHTIPYSKTFTAENIHKHNQEILRKTVSLPILY